MVTAASLKDQMSQKVRELHEAVSGLSEEKASQRPAEGEWCAKEVLSHLTGEEMDTFYADLKRFLEEDTPALDVIPGQAHFDDERKSWSTQALLGAVEKQYNEIGTFLAGLSDEQLNRKGHVPLLKETPIGEYPTLGQWAGALINFHLNDHVQQLQSLAK